MSASTTGPRFGRAVASVGAVKQRTLIGHPPQHYLPETGADKRALFNVMALDGAGPREWIHHGFATAPD